MYRGIQVTYIEFTALSIYMVQCTASRGNMRDIYKGI